MCSTACQPDEHEHRTGNFRTAALAALVVAMANQRRDLRSEGPLQEEDPWSKARGHPRRRSHATMRRCNGEHAGSSACATDTTGGAEAKAKIVPYDHAERGTVPVRDGPWSSTRNSSLAHWEAQTAHWLYDGYPLKWASCELRVNFDQARALADGGGSGFLSHGD